MRTISPTVGMSGDPAAVMREIYAKIDSFLGDVQTAQVQSAKTATTVTQRKAKRLRPIAPPRAGRHGTGQMAKAAKWRPTKTGQVQFNYLGMNKDQPHWIIQEIGTNARARVRSGGRPLPKGRPRKDATYVRTVKSQKGRIIRGHLVWARGGRYIPPITGRVGNDQLFLRQTVQGVPHVRGRNLPNIRIQREIKGQHFVREGGRAGFREFRGSVLTAARQQLKRQG